MTKAAEEVDTDELAAAASATVAAGAGIAAGHVGLERVHRTPSSRAFRLKSNEPVAEGLVRIACGRLEHAIAELDGETESDPAEAVHEARKDIKKLRSLLRLARDPLGRELVGRENAELRAIARGLGALRDADVVPETLEKLIADCPDLLRPVVAGRLRRALGGAYARSLDARTRKDAIAAARERLEVVLDRAGQWELDGEGWELLGEGMRRSYRRGRRRMRAARREPTDESLHEWRKRAKDHWYQLRIVRCSWPPLLEAVAEEAHGVSEQLGDDHDLGILAARFADGSAGPASDGDRERLEQAIERRRTELRAAAFSSGARLYAERPKAFELRFARYWQAQGATPRG